MTSTEQAVIDLEDLAFRIRTDDIDRSVVLSHLMMILNEFLTEKGREDVAQVMCEIGDILS
tara:strand:+ start:576 stop:758 length:183 start_codon:yes stop_codon:yes gene_type:complete